MRFALAWACALLLPMFVTLEGTAQQDPQSSIFTLAPLPFNPAYAGLSGQTNVRSISRLQWVGWGGAPTTHVLTYDAPFFRNFAGLGGTLIQDNVGARTQTSLMMSGAAHVQVGPRSTLSFGLNGGFRFNTYDFNNLAVVDPNDIRYSTTFQDWTPNVGAGLYVTTEMLFVGYSVPHLLLEDLSPEPGDDVLRRHHYAMAGCKVRDMRFTALFKKVRNAPGALDLTAIWEMSQRFSMGGLWRSGEALGLLMQFELSSHLSGVYCIEVPYNGLGSQTWGTHELGLIWSPSQKSVTNPRYF